MLTEQNLIDRGFVGYGPPQFSSAKKMYQKNFRDKNGKKSWSLIAQLYEIIHPTTHEDIGGWELSTQLYRKGTHQAINITFLEDDVDAAIELVEFLFDSGKVENYEE